MSEKQIDNKFYNMDCIEGCRKYVGFESVDLIITDPPYGIKGDKLHKHYHRDESHVLDGYIEIPYVVIVFNSRCGY